MIYIGRDKPEVGRTSVWNVYVYYVFFFSTQERGQRRSYVTVSFFSTVYICPVKLRQRYLSCFPILLFRF